MTNIFEPIKYSRQFQDLNVYYFIKFTFGKLLFHISYRNTGSTEGNSQFWIE